MVELIKEEKWKTLKKNIEDEFEKLSAGQFTISQKLENIIDDFREECETLKENYFKNDNQKRALYVEHNCLRCWAIIYLLRGDIIKFFEYHLRAWLVIRKKTEYSCRVTKKYLSDLTKISQIIKEDFDKFRISIDDLKDLKRIIHIIYTEDHIDQVTIKHVREILRLLSKEFEKISKSKPQEHKLEVIREILRDIKNILSDTLKKRDVKRKTKTYVKYNLSFLYELRYRMVKEQLFLYLKERKTVDTNLLEKSVEELLLAAKKSKEYFEGSNTKNITLAKFYKEIDLLNAKYLYALFKEKDLYSAWKNLDELRRYIFRAVMNDSFSVNKSITNYFVAEYSLIYSLFKLKLLVEDLRTEAQKIDPRLPYSWIRDSLFRIKNGVENILQGQIYYTKMRIFKENLDNFTLEIKTRNLIGHFSEITIYWMIKEIYDSFSTKNFNQLGKNFPMYFRLFLKDLREVREKERIIVGKRMSGYNTDLDIKIDNKMVIFIKNSKIKDMSQVTNEINAALKDNPHYTIMYAINSGKNINVLEDFKKTLLNRYRNNANIYIVDLSEFISMLFTTLRKLGKGYSKKIGEAEISLLLGA